MDNNINIESNNNYSPYCKVCSSCGEEGCCSPIKCKYVKNGEYCQNYLNDLKFSYLMYNDIYSLLKDDQESKEKIKEIFDKNWTTIYKTE